MANVVDGLARTLSAAGVGTYSPTEPLPDGALPISVAGMPGTDGAAIALTVYGGPEPDSRNGVHYPRLQVRVRHADQLQAMQLHADVFGVLQAMPYQTLPDGTELDGCYALESGLIPMGQDAAGRWEFARNYQLTHY